MTRREKQSGAFAQAVLLPQSGNIPKSKDRANWSRDTFQPMRRRACVYQQTNQNIAPVIKNFQNSGPSHRFEALRYIF